MERGLSHPEPTIQQRAHSLTHHSLGCICSTNGSFGSLPNYSFYSWGQSPTAWVPHPAPLWTVCSERCYLFFPKHCSNRKQLFEGRENLISAASSPAAAHSKGTLTKVSSFQVAQMELAAAGENRHVWKCYIWHKKKKKAFWSFASVQ